MNLAGRTVLERIIERLKRCEVIDNIIVATTPKAEDRKLIEIAIRENCDIFVGSSDHVAKRVLDAAMLYGTEIIVRITGDCPLIDPSVVDRTTEMVKDGFGYAASRLNPEAYPDGLDVDVVLTRYLNFCWETAMVPYTPEHIMEPVKDHPLISKGALPLTKYGPLGHYRWTLDTMEDYVWVKNVYDFYRDKPFGFEDVMQDLALVAPVIRFRKFMRLNDADNT
jgi:spore coat polysaccharide biosynthesis protein SpsF (cytidylyltransferase family)